MKQLKYKVYLCDRSEIEKFVEQWHYSKSMNGVLSTFCFKLMDGEQIIGAMVFGKLAMANAWKKYAESQMDVLELRRLCLVDDTDKFAESFFIGKALRILRTFTTLKTIVSYADPNHGHQGVIYKATNFSFEGKTAPGQVILFNDRQYHDKTIRTKYKGKLKPFAQKIKTALETGKAVYTKTLGKNIYLFNLSHKTRK